MSNKQLRRNLSGLSAGGDQEQYVFDIAFSDETPVQREFLDDMGYPILVNEILRHDNPAKIDLTRLNNGAPLLYQHNHDLPIGKVVEGSARIDPDGVGRCQIQFSAIGELANEVRLKVVEGTLSKISFGYDLTEYEQVGDDLLAYFAPFEVSIVSVPASDNVGINRNKPEKSEIKLSLNKGTQRNAETPNKEILKMADEIIKEEVIEVIEELELTPDEIEEIRKMREKRDEEVIEEEIVEEKIELSEDEIRAVRAMRDGKRAKPVRTVVRATRSAASRDTEQNLLKDYNLGKAIRAKVNGDALSGRELEVHQELARNAKSSHGGIFIPGNALARAAGAGVVASKVTKITPDGLDMSSFLDVVLQRSVLGRLNITKYDNLTQPLTLPKMTKNAVDAFGWVDENGVSPETDIAVESFTMTPKNFTGGVPMSKYSLQTVPDLERIVVEHIMRGSQIALEKTLFAAAGANSAHAPKSINDMFTATALKSTSFQYSDILQEIAKMRDAGFYESMTCVMTDATKAALMTTLKTDGVPGYIVDEITNTMCGLPVETTGLVGEGKIYVGDWSNIVLGSWGSVELDMDDTTYRSSGAIVPRIWLNADVGYRHDDALKVLVPKATTTTK
ncbi:phage major capsid protein [Citrobacter sp. Cpo114]|uniref:phage major capsid family protein n=1 Tax=Citrobacter sp. Cpo114 TaxID=2985147 RepID=UPI002581D6DA|nr:phage major capsid protein [Citrobacter sp. Cpo114]MDM2792500.1 phage major capsid protein [Citrobacter sp. Cpo114]